MGQASDAGTFSRQAPAGRPVTEADRWWLAYCALGAALIIRAPSWGWAALVVVLWAAVGPLSEWVPTMWHRRTEASEHDAKRAELRTQFTERARADKTVVIPTAPPATATEVLDRRRIGEFSESLADAAPGSALGAEVNRVVVSGQVRGTDELLREIHKVINRGRPPGGGRD